MENPASNYLDELTFVDLALLEKVDENTVVDKFGGKINSSFFDAASLLGTLKQKGLINFETSSMGLSSRVVLTDKGKGILAMAKEKGAQELENIDEVIISRIANGFNDPKALTEKLNMRSGDVAFHLQRLVMQDFASYIFKSGRLELKVTDSGFKRAGYAPLGSDEERKKESEDVESIISEHPPTAAAVPSVQQETGAPVKLDKQARLKAKAEYYSKDIVKYVLIAGVILIVLIAAGVYFFVLGGKV